MRLHRDQDPILVLVDEFVGTGSQFVRGLRKFFERAADKELITHYLNERRVLCGLLNAYPEATDEIKKALPGVKIVAAHIFGDDTRALDPEAKIFDSEADRKFTEEMLVQIGTELCPQIPLGWGRLGALVCLHNTVPNNTLPIFWSNGKVNEKPWNPLFPRP
jgi:hypothetical protein